MPIIGFNFDRIIVEKLGKIQKGMKVKNNLTIKGLTKEEISVGDSNDVVKLDFDFSVSYEPSIGNISLQGHLMFMEEKKKIEELIVEWNKTKQLPKDITPLILNTVLGKCNVKALLMSQEVSLPPHIRMPSIKPETKK
ncbi:hypothetical protein HOD61_02075 [archaeon]|jgi:hypothetical protein|nr:hypothetical protein [archaeon]